MPLTAYRVKAVTFLDPEVSVIIPVHSFERWDALEACVASVRAQRPRPARIVIAVDHNPELLARVKRAMPQVEAVPNRFGPGASGTRNTGVEVTTSALIAFLDSDVSARAGWLATLTSPLRGPQILGTGGRVAARWLAPRPKWFPDEFGWVIGATSGVMSKARSAVRNVWSENMAVRRDQFLAIGGFRPNFSKVGNRPEPEDTDLCLRMSAAYPDQSWIFVPDAIVEHEVGPGRSTFRYFLSRCFAEGAGKVEYARLNPGRGRLTEEYSYVQRMIAAGVRNYVARGLAGAELENLQKGGAVAAGLLAAAMGAAVAKARPRRR